MKNFAYAIIATLFLSSTVQAADFAHEVSGYLYENNAVTFDEYYATGQVPFPSAPSIIGYADIGSRGAGSLRAISYDTTNLPQSPCAGATITARKYLTDIDARDVILGVILIGEAPFVARFVCEVTPGAPVDAEAYFTTEDGSYIASGPVTFNP